MHTGDRNLSDGGVCQETKTAYRRIRPSPVLEHCTPCVVWSWANVLMYVVRDNQLLTTHIHTYIHVRMYMYICSYGCDLYVRQMAIETKYLHTYIVSMYLHRWEQTRTFVGGYFS